MTYIDYIIIDYDLPKNVSTRTAVLYHVHDVMTSLSIAIIDEVPQVNHKPDIQIFSSYCRSGAVFSVYPSLGSHYLTIDHYRY